MASLQTPLDLGERPPEVTMMEGHNSQCSTKKMKATKRSFADTVSFPPSQPDDDLVHLEGNEWAFDDPKIESDSEIEEQQPSDE